MIFVIDSSKSVNLIPGAFNDAKKFVLDIISNFDIGPNPTQSRVGIIIYGTEASVRLDLRKSGQIGGDGVKTWIQGKSDRDCSFFQRVKKKELSAHACKGKHCFAKNESLFRNCESKMGNDFRKIMSFSKRVVDYQHKKPSQLVGSCH